MRALKALWQPWSRWELRPWRKLRQAKAMYRALRRDNDSLRRRIEELEQERQVAGEHDYWFRRWDELRRRPAFVAQDLALARATTELTQARRELQALRRIVAEGPRPERSAPGVEHARSAEPSGETGR